MVEGTEGFHPSGYLLQTESIPSVWCPGCGIGTVVNTFIQAAGQSKIDLKKIYVVSGMGCTEKVFEYLNFISYMTTDSQVFEFAANIKSENMNSIVVIFSHNADFLVSGATDFIESATKGVNLIVIHVNNILYIITEQGVIPATPFMRISVNQNFVLPFNIPHLADSNGAQYVARWTPLRAGWLMYSTIETFSRKGLSLIEVISPCLIYFAGNDIRGDPVERMKFYDRHSVIKQGECTENLDIRVNNKLIIGKFVDKK